MISWDDAEACCDLVAPELEVRFVPEAARVAAHDQATASPGIAIGFCAATIPEEIFSEVST